MEVASGRTVGPRRVSLQFLSQRLIGPLCFTKEFSKDWGTVWEAFPVLWWPLPCGTEP